MAAVRAENRSPPKFFPEKTGRRGASSFFSEPIDFCVWIRVFFRSVCHPPPPPGLSPFFPLPNCRSLWTQRRTLLVVCSLSDIGLLAKEPSIKLDSFLTPSLPHSRSISSKWRALRTSFSVSSIFYRLLFFFVVIGLPRSGRRLRGLFPLFF